jgi:hypothetical protein
MKLRKTALILAMAALTCTASYAQYMVIINPDKSNISFSKPQWVETTPAFVSWQEPSADNAFYRYECQTWSPAPETVDAGTTFTQTSKDCKGKQYAQMAKQEKNTATQEVRRTDLYIDQTQEKVVTGLTKTRDAQGTKTKYLVIVNPVQGQSRIYQVSDGKGGTFPAYVNMTDDGGQWVLVARWAADPSIDLVTWNDLGVKGNRMLTYTNSASTYPVVPSNNINTSSRMLVKSPNTYWVASFGTWQSFATFAPNTVVGASGFAANTSIGAKTLFIRANGWNTLVPQDMTSVFGLFSQYGNGGPCGGNNRVGPNPICISYTNSAGAHFDLTSVKEVYIKAAN